MSQTKTIFLSLLFLICGFSLQAEEYFFMATQDHFYANPANWFPSYPGTEIEANDRVVLLEDANMDGFSLEVSGVLQIDMEVALNSHNGELLIKAGGLLENEGSVQVAGIINAGQVFNRQAGSVHIYHYQAKQGASTHNAHSAEFITLGSLTNEGKFDNYGFCRTGKDFKNVAIFNQICHSKLKVAGQLLLIEGCTFYRSSKSTVYRGLNEQLLLDDQVASLYL